MPSSARRSGTPRSARIYPSRTAELTTHGIDIADAIGLEVEVPGDALAETLRCVATMAVAKGHGRDVLRALSGRATLPPGFSVF